MNKLAVTLWNYKGGVGKKTISLILAEFAVHEGQRVLAIDLDEQQNLAGMLHLTGDSFPSVELRNTLRNYYAQTVLHALQFTNIALVPILGNFPSVMKLADVFDFIHSAGVGHTQATIINVFIFLCACLQ